MLLYFRDSLCSFLTGLGCPNCVECFTSQGLQSIYHLQNLTMEVTAPAGQVQGAHPQTSARPCPRGRELSPLAGAVPPCPVLPV